MLKNFNEITDFIAAHNRILICTHEDPDADAVGSVAAISLVLQALGKEVLAPYDGTLREIVDYLQPLEILTERWPDGFVPDAILVLDTSDVGRVGAFLGPRLQKFGSIPMVNIDHHDTNDYFGTLNYVEAETSSTCEIVARALLASEMEITSRIAGFLLAGIVSDTGRFRYDKTTPETLRIAAKLVEYDVSLPSIVRALELRISLKGFHLWGDVLSRASLASDERVVYSQITHEMFASADDAMQIMREMITLLMRTKGIELAVLFHERAPNLTNVSLRSLESVNCAKIAEKFGGGGHPGAAGCNINLSLDEAKTELLAFADQTFFF